VDPFDIHRVGEVMDRNVPTISAATTVGDFTERLRRDANLARRQGTPILDGEGRLTGIITRSDLMRALDADPSGAGNVLDAGTRNPVVAYEDELLRDAAARMLDRDIGRLPVVDRADGKRLIGYLGRSGILAARQRLIDDENRRERGPVPVIS